MESRILQEMLKMQKDLDELVIKRQQIIKPSITDKCTAMIHEVCELQKVDNFKWWKKAKPFSRAEAQEELIDILHFWLSVANDIGLDEDKIFEIYKSKNAINKTRQENGY